MIKDVLCFLSLGAKLVFDIYDFEGVQKLDAFYVGEALRALELNPTLAVIEKLGGTKKKGIYFYYTLHMNEFVFFVI